MEKEKKIIKEKIFPKIDKNLMDKIKIDIESLSYASPLHDSINIKNIIINHVRIPEDDVNIIDAMASIGCNTIIFAKHFKSVTAIEIDPKRYDSLFNNISIYELHNVKMIYGSCINIIPKLSNYDVIFIDPPWGGKDYKLKSNMKIKIDNLELENLIKSFFEYQDLRIVVVKLPTNYDISYFYSCLRDKFVIYMHNLKKMNIFVIERK